MAYFENLRTIVPLATNTIFIANIANIGSNSNLAANLVIIFQLQQFLEKQDGPLWLSKLTLTQVTSGCNSDSFVAYCQSSCCFLFHTYYNYSNLTIFVNKLFLMTLDSRIIIEYKKIISTYENLFKPSLFLDSYCRWLSGLH